MRISLSNGVLPDHMIFFTWRWKQRGFRNVKLQ